MKIQSIHIDKYKVFEDFDIDFRNEKGEIQNLIVIAGVNGCGKTTLLKDVIAGKSGEKIVNETKKREHFGSIQIVNETSPSEHQIPPLPPVGQTTLGEWELPDYISKIKYIPTGQELNSELETARIIKKYVDSFVYERELTSGDAYREINLLLNQLFSGFDIQFGFSGINRDHDTFFTNVNGEKFKINELSSGEKQIVNKILALYLDNFQNEVILIDEPEESLHPSWQYRIAPLYQKFADDNNCQIILATHSPQIISYVKAEQIRLLRNNDGKVQVINDFDGSLGWTVDRILLEIQGVGNRSPEIEKELDELSELIHKNEYEDPEFQNRFNKIEALLGPSDRNIILKKLEILRKKDKK